MLPADEDACRAVAGDIQRLRPGWLVLFGCFSRQYVAFPVFPVRQRVTVTAYYAPALVERMDEAERLFRIQ